MDDSAFERAMQRIADAGAGRPEPARLEAALERSRHQIETLAAAAAELESSIPAQVGIAVRDGLRAEVLPVARHIAEIRGLLNQAIRRLERLEGELLAERHARVDDLALLVDLVRSGWKGVDSRLARLEQSSFEQGSFEQVSFEQSTVERGTVERGTVEQGTFEQGGTGEAAVMTAVVEEGEARDAEVERLDGADPLEHAAAA